MTTINDFEQGQELSQDLELLLIAKPAVNRNSTINYNDEINVKYNGTHTTFSGTGLRPFLLSSENAMQFTLIYFFSFSEIPLILINFK